MPSQDKAIISNRQIDKLKKEFVSLVSHQMRTPLAAIKWNLEALLENKKGKPLNAWQKEKLTEAYQSNEREIELVNDMLNLSKIEAGKIDIILDKLNMHEVFKEVIQEMQMYAHANNVAIKVKFDAKSIPTVHADRGKIIQVIDNLISNAIKYTKGKGQVDINAEVNGEMVEFSVKDKGIGIPPEHQKRIFDKFFRAENAVSTQAEGSGLGLYIVRRLVEVQKGKIWFNSVQGKGTTFYFSLPIFK